MEESVLFNRGRRSGRRGSDETSASILRWVWPLSTVSFRIDSTLGRRGSGILRGTVLDSILMWLTVSQRSYGVIYEDLDDTHRISRDGTSSNKPEGTCESSLFERTLGGVKKREKRLDNTDGYETGVRSIRRLTQQTHRMCRTFPGQPRDTRSGFDLQKRGRSTNTHDCHGGHWRGRPLKPELHSWGWYPS